MIMKRVRSIPSKETFTIPPIKRFIRKYIKNGGKWIDPFARNSIFNKRCFATNDLNPAFNTKYHLEALEFLKIFEDESIYGVLFDPPYSVRQISECYKGIGREVHIEDTQAGFYTERKKEVARIVQSNGIVLSFGWNSAGIGKKYGFEILEILLVCFGGARYDTICVAERKVKQSLYNFIE